MRTLGSLLLFFELCVDDFLAVCRRVLRDSAFSAGSRIELLSNRVAQLLKISVGGFDYLLKSTHYRLSDGFDLLGRRLSSCLVDLVAGVSQSLLRLRS